MEDIMSALFLRLETRQDALDLLTVLCAEFSRQDSRRNERATRWAQCQPTWSVHYLMPVAPGDPVPLLAPVMALQMLKERFEKALTPPAPGTPQAAPSGMGESGDNTVEEAAEAHQKDIEVHWIFLRALVLVMLLYDGRMRALFQASPIPFWPTPPPARIHTFLHGPFASNVEQFLAIHDQTDSIGDAYLKAYDFVMHASHLWNHTVYVGE